MEENTSKENSSDNNSNLSSDEKDSASVKNSKKKNKDDNKGSNFFSKHKAEFKKIKWPNRQELFKETVVVIVISLAVGAIIFGADSVLQLVFGKIVNLL